MIGPSGSGKSLLLELMADTLRRAGLAVARVALPDCRPCEILAELCGQLGRYALPTQPEVLLWRRLADCLRERRYEQTSVVVLMDDADLAGPDVQTLLTRLVRHDPSPEMQLTVVLTATPGRLNRLDPRLTDLLELRIDLEPWESSATTEYLRQSLAKAGREEPLFDEAALQRLHDLGGGIPRRVAQLADLALLAGAAGDADRIGPDVVESVRMELSGAASS
jgi:type II secretory pathway predicted ATPase ExeA